MLSLLRSWRHLGCAQLDPTADEAEHRWQLHSRAMQRVREEWLGTACAPASHCERPPANLPPHHLLSTRSHTRSCAMSPCSAY